MKPPLTIFSSFPEDSIMSLVMAALPGIEEITVKNVCEKLVTLGVNDISDVEFVESKDVEDVLPLIQCRKLIQYFQKVVKSTNDSLIVEECNKNHPEPSTYILFDNSSSTEQGLCISAAPYDWAHNFEINWNDYPREILSACEAKTRPQNKYVSQMVRIIVSRILKIDVSPGRRNLRIIAQKIVSKYPETFQDSCIESVIAGGATTMMKKLEDCIDNQKRRNALVEKFSLSTEDTPLKKKRKTTRDSMGCIN